MKIFGREPAFYVGIVEALLALALSYNAFDLTQERMGAIVAVVTLALGFYTAYVTRDTMLGVGTGLAKSVLTLFAVYGTSFSDDQTAAIIGVVTIAMGLIQRTQTTPLEEPGFKTEPALATR